MPDKTIVFGSIGPALTCPQCQGEFVTIRVEIDLTLRPLTLEGGGTTIKLWPNGYVVHAEPCGHRVHETAELSFDEPAEVVRRTGQRCTRDPNCSGFGCPGIHS